MLWRRWDEGVPAAAPGLTEIKMLPCRGGMMPFMSSLTLQNRLLRAVLAAALLCAGPAIAAQAEPVVREIIPGSELMTPQEREQYRLRLRGAGTAEERERLRAEHVRVMEERARLRGLRVSDPSRERKVQP